MLSSGEKKNVCQLDFPQSKYLAIYCLFNKTFIISFFDKGANLTLFKQEEETTGESWEV